MRILSIDSAGKGCAACVWQDGEVLALAEERMERGQDARLVPLVQEVMAAASCAFDALDRIAVTRGPGSFTGLRIGLATARGLGLASGKPVIGVDRFSVFRAQQGALRDNLLVVIDSKRRELFVRAYAAAGATPEAGMMAPEELAAMAKNLAGPVVARGDALDMMRSFLPQEVAFCSATEPEVVTCAALAALADDRDPAFLPRPLYLRPPDVTVRVG
ncbi:MAG: tRNA (adenosine(37)-N6)-threonylcarbamoyltransferase complex dimerization subunit type 1 TsaB [Alphaproteobacteria bacterium]|nr:tRNA (adenosine(37)-N6)-threonylcarbamoyltransferase complex dimerization subunit type 1 TsaB [Alphaproteobacteria bacterium]